MTNNRGYTVAREPRLRIRFHVPGLGRIAGAKTYREAAIRLAEIWDRSGESFLIHRTAIEPSRTRRSHQRWIVHEHEPVRIR